MWCWKEALHFVGRNFESSRCCQKIAIITEPEDKDKYSDFGSMRFHEKMGYNHSRRLIACGYKFGHWYSTIYMDKIIQLPPINPQPIKAFNEVRNVFE